MAGDSLAEKYAVLSVSLRLGGADRSRRLVPFTSKRLDYIFFSSHILVVAFQVPPAFAQSASVFAAVTSPAKAGPVKASARVNAKIERRVFMAFTPLRWT